MSSAPDFNEVILARKIRRVLDEGAAQVSDTAAARLATARQLAMARKKAAVPVAVRQPVLVPALAGTGASRPAGPARPARLRVWLPLAALVAVLFGVVHWEDQQRVAELASLDAEVLSDALPLDAYLDHGFNEYLARSR
ncbi:DUF3619 family protein [Robbsia sp. Bb-Pol-6]|uniref:DUF3619 family protein n=1 Tax=Robbsia betulipollinis TaxID=2981849 RepID=A0ABT3ZMG6_9BURK|nr:DUF3619 family protein [Robbsia betulipollinis]MCY0387733.1 DUF3619 family protein [Robbsia betulipollinis]